jgi:ketosteroid isomerase-like protein
MPEAPALTKLISAIEAGDVEAARACYHPDAVIWHNNDEAEQTVDENLRVLEWLVRTFPGRVHYTEVQRLAAGEREVEQHVLEVTKEDGSVVRIPACIVVTVDGDGLVTRLEEYLDSASFGPLLT